eukprot:TRINITY_DN2644_c0_g1_i1.p1 TRINITY_DN2644_c0_g1~~TRINITY_DN2644_c0_g1_i1.p1  ORF type:complete len:84 (+),score=17.08 TRINITY_DN2644_c0_g1_i1:158-409(+)
MVNLPNEQQLLFGFQNTYLFIYQRWVSIAGISMAVLGLTNQAAMTKLFGELTKEPKKKKKKKNPKNPKSLKNIKSKSDLKKKN